MDQGPFRMPRPAAEQPTKRAATEQTEASRQPQPATRQYVGAPVRPAQPSAKNSKKWPFIIVIILVVVALVGAAIFIFKPNNTNGQYIDSSTYQAVFSTNGQVYFGKLKAGKGNELRLTEVYYVQPKPTGSDSESVESKTGNDLELIKLGSNEVYGPKNEMVFIKDQVLYYENLDPNGKVSNLIRDN